MFSSNGLGGPDYDAATWSRWGFWYTYVLFLLLSVPGWLFLFLNLLSGLHCLARSSYLSPARLDTLVVSLCLMRWHLFVTFQSSWRSEWYPTLPKLIPGPTSDRREQSQPWTWPRWLSLQATGNNSGSEETPSMDGPVTRDLDIATWTLRPGNAPTADPRKAFATSDDWDLGRVEPPRAPVFPRTILISLLNPLVLSSPLMEEDAKKEMRPLLQFPSEVANENQLPFVLFRLLSKEMPRSFDLLRLA